MKMASSSTTSAVISGYRGPSLPPQEPLRVSGPLCFSESHTSLSESGLWAGTMLVLVG